MDIKPFSMKNIIKIFIIIILVQSCTPMKKITYLNNNESGKWNISPIPPKHQLEIGDVLMVKVISRNEELNDLFNIESNTNSQNEHNKIDQQGFSLYVFWVDHT